ncbi:MAG TPA: hypothetical protein PLE85_10945 [Bacteroidales bacterium]|nr:hypothetical protein [Bacteroidales bacterium]
MKAFFLKNKTVILIALGLIAILAWIYYARKKAATLQTATSAGGSTLRSASPISSTIPPPPTPQPKPAEKPVLSTDPRTKEKTSDTSDQIITRNKREMKTRAAL